MQTLSVSKFKTSKLSQKLTTSKFDQVYIEKYKYFQYKIHINRFTIKYIFSMSSFDIANVYIFMSKLDQT
jgi:hypothetical protein